MLSLACQLMGALEPPATSEISARNICILADADLHDPAGRHVRLQKLDSI